jgi:hypothetical protein
MCKYYLICKNKNCNKETPIIDNNETFPKCFIRWFE